jgi:repressor LexA
MPTATRPMKPITPQQTKILKFVAAQIGKTGFAPSLEEIAKHLGLSTVSSPKYALMCLEKKGYLVRVPGVARGLRVLRNPDGTAVR